MKGTDMIIITNAEASERITMFAKEGRLIQRRWHKRHEGRELACILGAMHPQVNKPSDCNGKLMPIWMAEVTPTLFDKLPPDQIAPIALRYGALIGRWHVLSDADWQGVFRKFLIRIVDDALESARPANVGKASWEQIEKACQQVKAAIENGDKDAAAAAANAAAYTATAATAAAAAAAYTAATAAAANAAYAAAYAAAATRIFTFLLDLIEAATSEAEART